VRAPARCALRRGARVRRRGGAPRGAAAGARPVAQGRAPQPGAAPRAVPGGARRMSARRVVRVASGQGFWGDELEAPVRQVEQGPIDYLMLDYLAEVTMSIMRK